MYTSIYDSINMIYYKFYIYQCYKNLTVVWGKSLSRSGPDIKTHDPSLAFLWYDQKIYYTGRKIPKQRA